MPRPAHPSLANQLADMTTGNRLAAQLLLRIDFHFKSHFLPELRQKIHVPGSLVPEAEVVAFVHLTRV